MNNNDIIIIIISGSSEQIIYLFLYECFVGKINQRAFSSLQKWIAFNLKSFKRNIKLSPQNIDLLLLNNILFWFVYQGFLHHTTPNCRHWIAGHYDARLLNSTSYDVNVPDCWCRDPGDLIFYWCTNLIMGRIMLHDSSTIGVLQTQNVLVNYFAKYSVGFTRRAELSVVRFSSLLTMQ